MAIKTPHVAVDGIIEIYHDGIFQGIVLIERKNPPYGYALPGGFVDIGESVEDALKREMQEEVQLEVEIVDLLGVYSNPKRDTRFHTVSIVYICKADHSPVAADDAKTAVIVALHDLEDMDLVFDHNEIISNYLVRRSA
ncbi:MAG: NUDIX hydrolase [Campylobacterota bacterium]|nr:NUDIX hydrolase [Campylobacterota bacterium]